MSTFVPPVAAIRGADRPLHAGRPPTWPSTRGGLAEGLFGDYMATNLLALGVAYQAGLLPLTAASIEQAIG